ncbi:HEAT repeat domain-containing protein [Corallococcus llansteffanensis]|nr:HEAT repeat domain-containing protein [Corallococcus llansteffanensis]
MHRRWPVAVAVSGLLLGAGAFVASRNDGRGATEVAAATASPPTSQAPTPSQGDTRKPEHAREWEPGAQFAYALALEQRLTFGAPGAKDTSALLLSLTGSLTQTVVGRRPDQVDVQFQVLPTSFAFEADGQDALDADSRPRMVATLQSPFYVTFNRQGAALAILFERDVGPIAQNLLRSLAASTQFVSPGSLQETWEAQELDTTGQYVARYQRQAGAREYTKKKERYLRLATADGLKPVGSAMRVTPTSETTLALGPEGWLQVLEGRERMTATFEEGMPPIQGEGRVSLQRTAARNVPFLIGALDARRAQLARSSMATQVLAPPDPQQGLKQLVAGAKLSDLVQELRTLSNDGKPTGPRTAHLMNRMRALFQLEPESATRVPDLLRDEKRRDVYSPLLGALSAASTPQALQALATVATHAQTPGDTRVNATAMLGMAESPTPEGTQALRDLSRDKDAELSTTATLALGNVARHSGGPEGTEAQALLRELEDAARAAPTPEARSLWIRSLANSADPRILPFLQECLRDPLPLIRQSALEAMRLIPSPLADQLLAEALLKDGAPEVRRAAIFAGSFRPLPPLLVALGQALRMDAVDAVRMDAVRLLGSNVVQVPLARELLTWSGQNDSNGEIRHTALAFLAPPTRSVEDPQQP